MSPRATVKTPYQVYLEQTQQRQRFTQRQQFSEHPEEDPDREYIGKPLSEQEQVPQLRWGGEAYDEFSSPLILSAQFSLVHQTRLLSQVRTPHPTTWSALMQVNPDYPDFVPEGVVVWTAVFELLVGVGQTNVKMIQSVNFTPGTPGSPLLPIQVTWNVVPAEHISSRISLHRAVGAPARGPFHCGFSSLVAPLVVARPGAI